MPIPNPDIEFPPVGPRPSNPHNPDSLLGLAWAEAYEQATAVEDSILGDVEIYDYTDVNGDQVPGHYRPPTPEEIRIRLIYQLLDSYDSPARRRLKLLLNA